MTECDTVFAQTGSERLILNREKNVKLTKSERSATIDFEMNYRPIQMPPR
jgi:hypothetical protein